MADASTPSAQSSEQRPRRSLLRRVFAHAVTQGAVGSALVLLFAFLILPRLPLSALLGKAGRPPEQAPALDISSLVKEVRSQLEAVDAERRTAGKTALFELDSFDLEINFLVETSASAGAEAKATFLVVERDTQFKNQSVQKIRLHWKASKLPPLKLESGDPAGKPPAGARPVAATTIREVDG